MKILRKHLFLSALTVALIASTASATVTERLDALLDAINDTAATATQQVQESVESAAEKISGEYTLDINLPEGEFAISHTPKPATTIWNRLSHKLKRLGCLVALRYQYAKEWVKEKLA